MSLRYARLMGRSLAAYEAMQHLEEEGHLAGASESLLADLADHMAQRRAQARVEAVRSAMVRHLRAIDAPTQDIANVQAAADLTDLWALRDRFSALVALHRPADRADHILRTVTALFIGDTPAEPRRRKPAAQPVQAAQPD